MVTSRMLREKTWGSSGMSSYLTPQLSLVIVATIMIILEAQHGDMQHGTTFEILSTQDVLDEGESAVAHVG